MKIKVRHSIKLSQDMLKRCLTLRTHASKYGTFIHLVLISISELKILVYIRDDSFPNGTGQSIWIYIK